MVSRGCTWNSSAVNGRWQSNQIPEPPVFSPASEEAMARPKSKFYFPRTTLVIEIDGVRVLTDPVWSNRASPLPFAGPKRFHPPPAPLDALPPLDAVILSHDHYDHLDRSTVLSLATLQPGTSILTSLGVGERLERWGIPSKRVTELDWWDVTDLNGVAITAAPAQHFSGRGIKDRNATAWSSCTTTGNPSRTWTRARAQ